MRVLLISANVADAPYPVYPLGMSMVAAALRDAGHAVRLIDFLHLGQSLEAVGAAVSREQPGLVGISMRNLDNVNMMSNQRYVEAVRDIVGTVRQHSRARVILGGSGFGVLPGPILRYVGADYGVVGEGERAFVAFVADAVRGVFPAQPLIQAEPELEGRDIPSGLYDPDILSFYLTNGSVAAVQSKRGCSHRCLYCSYPVLEGHAIRPRDPAAVADDVERLVRDHGVGYLFFTDSVFNDDDGRYLEVVHEMKRRGLRVPWTGFFKPKGRLTRDVVALMKETGLKAVELGTDAACDTTLRCLGKDFLFADAQECNNLFLDHGIATAHYVMFGGPGETPDTVREGIENLKRLRKSAIFVFLGIRLLPKTGLHRIAVREGLVAEGDDLLESIYYLSPRVERAWVEAALTEAFKDTRHILFPPEKLDASVRFLLKLGYSGSLWDMLVQPRRANRRRPETHGAPEP